MSEAGETLRLATPWAVLLLGVIPVALWWVLRRARPPRLVYSSTGLLDGLRMGWRARLRATPLVLRLAALALLVLALARPQVENRWQEVTSEGVDIVVALDQSGSMAAVDLGRKGGRIDPVSRLDYAQRVVNDFVAGRQADRIGLVAFAGRAFTRCPLTLDYGLLVQILDSIAITKRYDGTAIGMGLATSVNRLKDSEARSKVVILVTDGRNNAGEIDPETAARLASTMGVKVYTVGVGSEGVAPIPVDDPVFGPRYVFQPVDLDEKTLRRIADLTDGKYFRATDAEALGNIFARIDDLETTEVKVKERVRRSELFPWLLIPGGVLLLLEMTLGWTVFRQVP